MKLDTKQAMTIAVIAIGAACLSWLGSRYPQVAPFSAAGVPALVAVLVGAMRSYLPPDKEDKP